MNIDQVRNLNVLERLNYWIMEREKIRAIRGLGGKAPWTDDVILQTYKFCNVRRMDDRVSKWLLENWYVPFRNHPNMVYAAALARFINLHSSLGLITSYIFRTGQPDWVNIKECLRHYRDGGHTIFNGAYMVRGNDGMDKIECVVDYYVRPLKSVKIDPDGMKMTWEAILPSYGMGSFMAGQITADLRWAVKGNWKDRGCWAPAGPGSIRGLNRLHGRPLKTSIPQSRFERELAIVMRVIKTELPSEITRRLEAIDYQNCLCEFDKYERALRGEGKPKQLYRGGK